MNDGYDYLCEIVHSGFLKLRFDSETQQFSVAKEECKDLTDDQIVAIMNGLEKKLEEIRVQSDKTSGFIDINETPSEN